MLLVRLEQHQQPWTKRGGQSIRIFLVSNVLFAVNTMTKAVLEYISQAPWYLDQGRPSLSHQRQPESDAPKLSIDKWYDRGKTQGPAATKYRKGACENCGAITHKRQDCLERPRKKGARFTNKDIAPDELIQDLDIGYDAKRDRWNGYDPSEHKKIYEEYAALEAARRELREEQIDNQTSTDMAVVKKVAKAGKTAGDNEFGSSDEEGEDEDKYADAADAVGQKLDTKTRITVRNLRIREDTAKYLINLDEDSAYYDPKTRSMRDAPDKTVAAEDVSLVPSFLLLSDLLHPLRLCSLETISCVTLDPRPKCNVFNYSLGNPPHEETMSISTQTQRRARSFIDSSKRKRKNSRAPPRRVFWLDMVERSTWKRHPGSYLRVKPSSTSSIPGQVRS